VKKKEEGAQPYEEKVSENSDSIKKVSSMTKAERVLYVSRK